MKWIALALLLSAPLTQAATFNLSAIKIKVYGVWVSTDPLCSNPVNVFETASPLESNLIASPQLGGGDLADGTYHCVMIKMSDQIKLEHSGTGNCTGYQINTPQDIFVADVYGNLAPQHPTRFGGLYTNATRVRGDAVINNLLVEESADFEATSNEDQVFLFLSTTSTQVGRAIHHRPRQTGDDVFGEKLTAPFVVNGSTAGTLKLQGLSQITDNGTSCGFLNSTDGITWSFE